MDNSQNYNDQSSNIDTSDNYDIDDLFEELDNDSDDENIVTPQSELQNLAGKHGLGGFENMSNNELGKFKDSNEYKNYSAEIDNDNIKTNIHGKTVQEILGLSNIKESVTQSFNAFEHYDVDIEFYQDIVDTSPVMQKTIEDGNEIYPTFEYMYQDIFLSLYKYKARLLSESDMHMSTRMNRKFAKAYLNTPEYIKLRQTCRMDQFNAALGTEIIGKKLLSIVEEVMKQIKEQDEAMKKMRELLKKEQEMDELLEENESVDELLQDMIANGQGNSPAAQQLQAQINANNLNKQQVQTMANQIAEEMDELMEEDDLAGEIAQQAGKSFDEASTEVAEVSDLVDAWGLGGGERARVSYQNKKDAIEIIRKSPKLRELTDLIGRFKESAITEQKKKIKNGAVEISSVTNGKKIEDTLPSERMMLANGATKGDFYNRYSEGRLLVYSKESNKSKNKGPMIVCCDTSGSMSGDREMWSKAFTMGVLEIAQIQKRDFACILYSDTANDPIILKKDEVSPNKVIEICETFDSGGTDFERPLKKALEMINTSAFKEADILFITDGDCGVSDKFKQKFKEMKEEKEFVTRGILIDMGRYHSSDATLREFCDDVVRISDIAELKNGSSDSVKNLFGSL